MLDHAALEPIESMSVHPLQTTYLEMYEQNLLQVNLPDQEHNTQDDGRGTAPNTRIRREERERDYGLVRRESGILLVYNMLKEYGWVRQETGTLLADDTEKLYTMHAPTGTLMIDVVRVLLY